MSRPAYRLYHLAWSGLDWLYPPQCGGCESLGRRWCARCQEKTERVVGRLCLQCGRPGTAGPICRQCQGAPPSYSSVRSWAYYRGPVRQAIRRLKYGGDIGLAEALAQPLLSLFAETGWQVDLVVPVPAGVARLTGRGYNQAALLAYPLALGSGLTYRPQALVRARETRTQVGLTQAERRLNVQGAFQAPPELVAHRNILVVDDVTTSGATLEACATALLRGGAAQVYGLTLAQAGWEFEDGAENDHILNQEVYNDTGS